MALTLGSSLQAGRYTLEETLFVDDYCTTYRATQQESDQPVALQVLNAVGADATPTDGDEAEKFNPLQQEFLATARDRIHHPSSDFPTVLDSFVEQGLPIVVFEYERDRPIPSVKDWLPSLEVVKAIEALPAPSPLSSETDESPVVDAHQASQPATEPELAIAPPSPAEAPEPGLTTPSVAATSEPAPDAIATPTTTPTTVQPTREQIDIDRQFAAARAAAEAAPHSSIRVTVSPRPSMVQRLAIPLGLVLTAAVTGGAGAAIGWHLRHGEAASDGVPILGPLLTNEQAFPPIEGWPSRSGSLRDRPEMEPKQSRPRSRSTADYIPISEAPIYYDRQHRMRATREAPTEFVDESLPLDPVPLYRNTAAPLYSAPESSDEEPVLSDPIATDDMPTGEEDAIAPNAAEAPVAAPPAPSKLGQELPLTPPPAPVAAPPAPAAPAAAPAPPPAPTAIEPQPATSLPQ
ncbi:hypothetical protein ACQ4M4_05375 [Leptolyngbya sp. AN02str]|uniref:hypothetical protein n=1 Tax=Leptolyngbya sp. AN02str TaxID=3423363 RepID=UPI003D32055F